MSEVMRVDRGLAGWLCLIMLVLAGPVRAQGNSELSNFQGLSAEELQTVQIRFSFLGSRSAAVPPVFFAVSEAHFDPDVFVEFERPGIPYSMAGPFGASFVKLTEAEMDSVMDALSGLPFLLDAEVVPAEAGRYIALAVARTAPGDFVYERILDESDTAAVYEAIRLAPGLEAVAAKLDSEMCAVIDEAVGSRPLEVSSSVTIDFSALRPSGDEGDELFGTAIIVNESTGALDAPLSLVVYGSFRLVDPSGITCGLGEEFERADYISIDEPVPAGESVEVPLRLVPARSDGIEIEARLWAGPGRR